MLFDEWTRPEVVAAIRALEQGLVTGYAQIAYPNAGSLVMSSREDMLRTLAALRARRDVLDGAAVPRAGGVRFIRVLPFG